MPARVITQAVRLKDIEGSHESSRDQERDGTPKDGQPPVERAAAPTKRQPGRDAEARGARGKKQRTMRNKDAGETGAANTGQGERRGNDAAWAREKSCKGGKHSTLENRHRRQARAAPDLRSFRCDSVVWSAAEAVLSEEPAIIWQTPLQ